MIYNNITIGGEIYHHGVKGMKWGVRRYQPYGTGYSAKTKGKFLGKVAINNKNKLSVGTKSESIKSKTPYGSRSIVSESGTKKNKNLMRRFVDYKRKKEDWRKKNDWTVKEVKDLSDKEIKEQKYKLAATAVTGLLVAGVTVGVGAAMAKKGKMIAAQDIANATKYSDSRKAVNKMLKNTLSMSAKASAGTIIGNAIVKKVLKNRNDKDKMGYSIEQIKRMNKENEKYKDKTTTEVLKKDTKRSAIRTGVWAGTTLGTAALTSAATLKLARKGNPVGATVVNKIGKITTSALIAGTMASTVLTGRDATAALLSKANEKRLEKKKAS